ncbi:hypothetical protein M3J09_012338 [Ascochyta lentis]
MVKSHLLSARIESRGRVPVKSPALLAYWGRNYAPVMANLYHTEA